MKILFLIILILMSGCVSNPQQEIEKPVFQGKLDYNGYKVSSDPVNSPLFYSLWGDAIGGVQFCSDRPSDRELAIFEGYVERNLRCSSYVKIERKNQKGQVTHYDFERLPGLPNAFKLYFEQHRDYSHAHHLGLLKRQGVLEFESIISEGFCPMAKEIIYDAINEKDELTDMQCSWVGKYDSQPSIEIIRKR
tara:strand:- start:1781 stop:2356 length:576 start_codon:yes stop_codon:yes gene_type:complete